MYETKTLENLKDDARPYGNFTIDTEQGIYYVQGACCHKGKIYSLEGFTDSADNPPAIRIIDTKLKKEIFFKKFSEFGTNIEPEMIDFEDDRCYYTDHYGNIYKLFFCPSLDTSL